MDDDYFRFWAKADRENPTHSYHLLPWHLLDVAAVVDSLFEEGYPLCHTVTRMLGLRYEDSRSFLVFYAATHDLGKFSRQFQQVSNELSKMLLGERADSCAPGKLHHSHLGLVGWKGLIWKEEPFFSELISHAEAQDIDLSDEMLAIHQAIFGHHGRPVPEDGRVSQLFGPLGRDAAKSFTKELLELLRPSPEAWLDVARNGRARIASWWISGLITLSDWIGSDKSNFAYHAEAMPVERYWLDHALPSARRAIEQIGILPSKPRSLPRPSGIFPALNNLRPLQQFAESVEISDGPGLYILEDLTGSGKTEAALILAFRIMSQGLASGVFFGLPTMAIANQIYQRLALNYRMFFEKSTNPSLLLSHSSTEMVSDFRQSILWEPKLSFELANEEEKDEEDKEASCNLWFADRKKKGLFADVAVGTIDQALLSVLPVKHQSLRLAGLSSKVLILDEIHSYDDYMSELIVALLKFHRASGGSVILLSATMSASLRQKLIDVFDNKSVPVSTEYPLVTVVDEKGCRQHPIPSLSELRRTVRIFISDDRDELIEKLKQTALAGQSVCWIRNTVEQARELYDQIKESNVVPGSSLRLVHSRFTLFDRSEKERDLERLFGPKSTAADRSGQIVIATQVVEQSLDLDFDLLISDLAPIDALIQRAGRLKRHRRDRSGNPLSGNVRDERGEAEFFIFSPDPAPEVDADWLQELLPKTEKVYPAVGLLWRTALILKERGSITVPDDLRDLIEFVFSEEQVDGGLNKEIPASLRKKSDEAAAEAFSERSIGRINSLEVGRGYKMDRHSWGVEEDVATRLGMDSIDIYLARVDGSQLTPWASGEFAWELSAVKVYDYLWKRVSVPKLDPERLPDERSRMLLKREVAFLPLSESSEGLWNGFGWSYSVGRGLELVSN
jgi:CRISPR-associated endonuclease/helicase Cas3